MGHGYIKRPPDKPPGNRRGGKRGKRPQSKPTNKNTRRSRRGQDGKDKPTQRTDPPPPPMTWRSSRPVGSIAKPDESKETGRDSAGLIDQARRLTSRQSRAVEAIPSLLLPQIRSAIDEIDPDATAALIKRVTPQLRDALAAVDEAVMLTLAESPFVTTRYVAGPSGMHAERRDDAALREIAALETRINSIEDTTLRDAGPYRFRGNQILAQPETPTLVTPSTIDQAGSDTVRLLRAARRILGYLGGPAHNVPASADWLATQLMIRDSRTMAEMQYVASVVSIERASAAPRGAATAADPLARFNDYVRSESLSNDSAGATTPIDESTLIPDIAFLYERLRREDFTLDKDAISALHLKAGRLASTEEGTQLLFAGRLARLLQVYDDADLFRPGDLRELTIVEDARVYLRANAQQFMGEHHARGDAALAGLFSMLGDMSRPVLSVDGKVAVRGVAVMYAEERMAAEFTYGLIRALEGILYLPALAIGVVEGVWDSIRDTLTTIPDLVGLGIDLVKLHAKIYGSIVSGTFVGSVGILVHKISALIHQLPALLGSLWADFKRKWFAQSLVERGRFQGKVVGYLATEIIFAVISFGGTTVAKYATEGTGKLAKIIAALRKVDQLSNPAELLRVAGLNRVADDVADVLPAVAHAPIDHAPSAPHMPDAPSAPHTPDALPAAHTPDLAAASAPSWRSPLARQDPQGYAEMLRIRGSVAELLDHRPTGWNGKLEARFRGFRDADPHYTWHLDATGRLRYQRIRTHLDGKPLPVKRWSDELHDFVDVTDDVVRASFVTNDLLQQALPRESLPRRMRRKLNALFQRRRQSLARRDQLASQLDAEARTTPELSAARSRVNLASQQLGEQAGAARVKSLYPRAELRYPPGLRYKRGRLIGEASSRPGDFDQVWRVPDARGPGKDLWIVVEAKGGAGKRTTRFGMGMQGQRVNAEQNSADYFVGIVYDMQHASDPAMKSTADALDAMIRLDPDGIMYIEVRQKIAVRHGQQVLGDITARESDLSKLRAKAKGKIP